MASTTSEIRVEFDGEGAGAGELTWGQMGIWRNSLRYDGAMNLVWTTPPPDGATLADVVSMLRFMVSRHPVLRTRLRFGEGPSGARHPRQVVAASGEVSLHITDIGDDDDLAAVAEELRARWEVARFDFENEFPVRMGVIRQSGKLVRLVVCHSHVMVDGGALALVDKSLKHRDRVTGEATAPAAGEQSPLELAGWQDGPAGQRQSERAIKYWAAQLARLPVWRPDEQGRAASHGYDGPRIAELWVYSPALDLGMRAVGMRTGADATSVLVAAYSAAVARVLGRDPSPALLTVGNRFRPGLADVVVQVAQHGICVVDVAGATFDEVVARAQKATTGASFYGYYDPVACDRLLDEAAARRGQPLDIHWWVNDLRGVGETAGDDGTVPTDAELAKALPRTWLCWNPKPPTAHGTLFMFVDSQPYRLGLPVPDDGLPGTYLKVWADTQHFALPQIEALVREMEAVVVAAAFAP